MALSGHHTLIISWQKIKENSKDENKQLVNKLVWTLLNKLHNCKQEGFTKEYLYSLFGSYLERYLISKTNFMINQVEKQRITDKL